jgi:hypothetical protein
MIVVSNEMFERLIARAQAVGEEIWRRQLFEQPGMFPKAKPEEIEVVRELFVAAMAEDYCERVAHAAHGIRRRRALARHLPEQKDAADAVKRAVGGLNMWLASCWLVRGAS